MRAEASLSRDGEALFVGSVSRSNHECQNPTRSFRSPMVEGELQCDIGKTFEDRSWTWNGSGTLEWGHRMAGT
jgi:hypothetical protein